MRKLIAKLFLAGFPLLIVIAIYLYNDPFKVIYRYDSFYDTAHEIAGVNNITINRDYVSTEMFLKNYSKYQYDSYIFGNSRSGFYQVAEWQKYINSTRCFHFDSYNECLYGIEKKVEFLHAKGVKLKNALFIVDPELLSMTTNPSVAIYRKHPLISGEAGIDFQLSMFKSFLDVDFLTNYIKRLMHGINSNDTVGKNLPSNGLARYDEVLNEERWWADTEVRIARNSDSFYRARAHIFYRREAVLRYANPVVKQAQINMLNSIKKMLDADHADYHIILNPLYSQLKADSTDVAILQSIFGKNRVHDFSGINEITQNVYNYYETSHYRTHIATQLMKICYENQPLAK